MQYSDHLIQQLNSTKKIITLALPMAISQLINVASGFLCMAMLASLGHTVLAASALISTTQLSIMVTGMSLLYSLSVLVGHAYGAKNYSVIGNYVQQGWTFAFIISLPVIFLFWHIAAILKFFGQPIITVSIVQHYFHNYVWAVIPGFLSTCNIQFGYAIQKKKLIFSVSAASVIVLLITAYSLIFGKMGAPKLGVAGLGIAIAAQYSFFFIITTLFFYYQKKFKPFELFGYRVHQHLEYFIQMLKIGWPISMQMGGEMLSFFVSGILIGWLGTTALAAFQIVNQYYFLIVIPIFSLSQATAILVGHSCGAKQFNEVKKLSYAGISIVFMISIIVGILFLVIPTKLAAVYLDVTQANNAATLHLTILIFSVIAFSQLFDALRNILIGILRGLFDTRLPMFMNLSTIWIIGMPLAYLLAFPLHFGAVGFVVGGMLGMLCAAIIMFVRWYDFIYLRMVLQL